MRPSKLTSVARAGLLGFGLSACSDTQGDQGSGGGGAGGNGADWPCKNADRFASRVVEVSFGDGQKFGQDQFPDNILGGPRGRGPNQGSLDVVSLGDGGSIVLGFSGAVIVNGPGPDLLVFENPFFIGGDEANPLAELGRVAVSDDGETWFEFPCSASSYPYGSCAGWHPVLANVDDADAEPFDPAKAGGDPFDLADVGLEQARFVRIVDVEGDDAAFDLDAIAIVHAACR